ncbi:MAG TPA: hypothetical protein VN867_16135 [Candidatus Binataceae bacterium]|nr:hypothetical protein [Candidatus Binataceae bacterium]
MKKILAFGAVVVFALLVSGVVQAQSDPVAGIWKLNTAKSKYSEGPAPKNLTLTFEAQGDGVKGRSEGTAADGSHRAWSFAATYDGKDNPISGIGPAGADTIAIKRINPTAIATTYKKAGKVVRTSLLVVSKDGKVMMIKAKAPGADSQPDVLVLDKQ